MQYFTARLTPHKSIMECMSSGSLNNKFAGNEAWNGRVHLAICIFQQRLALTTTEEKLDTKVSSKMTRPKNIASHQVTGDGAELVLDSDWMD